MIKLILFTTCLWHTTLTHKGLPNKELDLVQRPVIGKKIRINGQAWKVTDTKKVCNITQ